MKDKVLWIARDKNNYLFLYEQEPIIEDGEMFGCDEYSDYWQIPEELYPEITFENSPKQLIIKQD